MKPHASSVIVSRLAACLAVVFVYCAGWQHPLAGQEAAPAAAPRQAVLVRFEGTITPLLEHFLYRKLAVAEQRQVDVVIIEIDSPGGFVDSSFNIAHRLRDLDWAETVAYVPREALSGAAIVALGCDRIVMDPGAVMGDAGPIFQGEDALFRHAPEKLRSDIALKIRDLAVAKGRPAALAEAMVDMNLVVYRVTNRRTGENAFMSDAEIEASADPGVWEKGPPVMESREDHFLEVNGARAVELQLAKGNANDREDLYDQLSLSEPALVLGSSGVDTAVFVLNLPVVTGLLFIIGLVALYVELSAPGISIGGLISLLCFSLFFWSRFLGGTAEWLELILFVAGLIFVAVEIFVIPGLGLPGLLGGLLMLVGVVMASQSFLVPNSGRELGTLSTSLLVVAISAAAVTASAVAISRYFGGLPIVNRLVLKPAVSEALAVDGKVDDEGKPLGVVSSSEGVNVDIGDWGVAMSPLRPSGKARFGERYLDVMADGTYVERGRQIRIIEIRGGQIVVRDVEDI